MSVHGRLRLLVTEHGDRVLQAGEDLRGLLDDYFAEGELSVGELNLLVDAVRMHALERLLALLDQGADPRSAVEASGLALAAERSGDVRSAAWAVAALGHAVGRVPEGLVLAYEDRTSPTTPPPSSPAGPPQPAPSHQAPATQPPPQYRPAQPPPYLHQPGPGGHVAGAAARPAWQQPGPPTPRSRTGLLLVGGALLALLVLLAVAIVVSTGDDPTTPEADAGTAGTEATTSSDATPSDSVETTDPTTPEPEPEPGTPVPLSDLSAQFASLGSTVAADATGCEVIRDAPGTTDRVRCRYQQLRVVYAAYADEDAFDAARDQQRSRLRTDDTDYRESNVDLDAAFLLGTGGGRTWLHWDARADLTSGFLESPTPQLSERAAKNWFDQRGDAEASRVLPAAVPPFDSDALWELATYYVGDQVRGGRVRGCVSNPNLDPPFEQEQRVQCVDGDFELTFTAVPAGDLEPARDHFAESADVNSSWDWVADEDATYPIAGVYMLTYGDAGKPLVYFDDAAQGVYGFVTNPASGHDRAVTYFGTGDATAS